MMLPLFLTPFARLPPRKTSCRGLHTWDNWQNRGEGTPDRITYFEKLPIKQALFRWAYRARAFCDLPRDARVPLGRFLVLPVDSYIFRGQIQRRFPLPLPNGRGLSALTHPSLLWAKGHPGRLASSSG